MSADDEPPPWFVEYLIERQVELGAHGLNDSISVVCKWWLPSACMSCQTTTRPVVCVISSFLWALVPLKSDYVIWHVDEDIIEMNLFAQFWWMQFLSPASVGSDCHSIVQHDGSLNWMIFKVVYCFLLCCSSVGRRNVWAVLGLVAHFPIVYCRPSGLSDWRKSFYKRQHQLTPTAWHGVQEINSTSSVLDVILELSTIDSPGTVYPR